MKLMLSRILGCNVNGVDTFEWVLLYTFCHQVAGSGLSIWIRNGGTVEIVTNNSCKGIDVGTVGYQIWEVVTAGQHYRHK